MANVACFCGCCFSFAGTVAGCPDCGEVVTLTTASAFAADGADGAQSVCVVQWNGPPSTGLAGWEALHAAVAEQAPPQVVYGTL